MECFKDDDKGYLQWVNANPSGFVVNTARWPDPNYLMLHRATCRTIKNIPTSGSKRTENYIKICSLDRMELESCVTLLTSGGLKFCTYCNP